MDWPALGVTLKLACATTMVLGVVGVPLAFWLQSTTWRGRWLLETVVSLPLVLPPTVLGFFLLVLLGPQGPLGQMYHALTGGGVLPFTFLGILLGSTAYNLPFALQPFMAAFSAVDTRLIEASHCLGVSRSVTFFRVILPLSRRGVLTGLMLTFAHAMGEFGVVMMLGGNVAGVTRTASVSIYDAVAALDHAQAAATSAVMLALSFVILAAANLLNPRRAR